jgi:hypothetical protein
MNLHQLRDEARALANDVSLNTRAISNAPQHGNYQQLHDRVTKTSTTSRTVMKKLLGERQRLVDVTSWSADAALPELATLLHAAGNRGEVSWRGHEAAVIDELFAPLAALAMAMLQSEALDVHFISVTGHVVKNSTRAVDAWVLFAEWWKQPATTAALHLLSVGSAKLLAHWTAVMSATWHALAAVLSTRCPLLVRTECVEAVAAMCRGMNATMGWLLRRLDSRAAPPRVRCEEEVFARSPCPAAATVDVPTLVALGVVREAVAVLLHVDLASQGDDTGSAVSLSGTVAPAQQAAEHAACTALGLDGLVLAGREAIIASVSSFMDHYIAPDYASQRWLTHNVFFGGKVASHSVRFSLVSLRLHWLSAFRRFEGTLVACRVPSLQFAGLTETYMTDAVRGFAAQWLSLIASVKATAARTPQLAIDALYLVRGVRCLRTEWNRSDARLNATLAQLLAVVAVRCAPLQSLSKSLANLLEGDSSAIGAQTVYDDVWEPPVLPTLEVSPLRCFDFGAAAAESIRVDHDALMRQLPSIDSQAPAGVTGRLGDLLDVGGTPTSLRHQLSLRSELWSAYPALDDDEDVAARVHVESVVKRLV